MAGPQANPYATHQPPPLPPSGALQAPLHSAQPNAPFNQPYAMPNLSGDRMRLQQPAMQPTPPTSAPRSSALSRLNTGEMQIQAPPQGGLSQPGQQPVQQTQAPRQQQDQPNSSPAIYFHHWVPPNSTTKDPPTPTVAKSQGGSPYSQHATTHMRSEYGNSPKKRKANNGSSTSRTPETSPTFSHLPSGGRRRAYSTQRSDGSQGALSGSSDRSDGRHRQNSLSEGANGRHSSMHPEYMSSRHSVGPEKKRTISGTPKTEAEGGS